MSLSSKVFLSFLLGAVAALVAWIIIDFNGFYRLENLSDVDTLGNIFKQQAFVGATFGLLMGLAMGLVNGINSGSVMLRRRHIIWGGAVGLGGGLLGLLIGQWFFGPIYQTIKQMEMVSALGPLAFVFKVVVRGIGWGFIGLFIGLVQGLPIKSKKAARHGAIGGLIGGLLGGMLFEVVPFILPPLIDNPGVISRGISMTITGASIGLFIGLVETLLKQAWIRVVQGKNEGKEYIISKAQTTIGRDELSDIALFGDRDISPMHALIESSAPGRYVLRDSGNPIGTNVNGQRIQEYLLRDGDNIQIGSMQLEFHEKAGAKYSKPVDSPVKPSIPIPSQSDICPFCGTKKDPITGACACSLGNQAPSAGPGGWGGSVQDQNQPQAPYAASGTGMGPGLSAVGGLYNGQAFKLSPSGTTNIGREAGRDIELSMDSTVSRKHAHIAQENGEFVLYDDGSANGTMVNGMRITRQVISNGDTIEFGNSKFRFDQ
ncbi:MAG: FHA domain-containing protein [Armatimonadota bacterium]